MLYANSLLLLFILVLNYPITLKLLSTYSNSIYDILGIITLTLLIVFFSFFSLLIVLVYY